MNAQNYKKDLEEWKLGGNWLFAGIALTIGLALLGLAIFLLIKWPIAFGIIFTIVGLPFLLGRMFVWRIKYKLYKVNKRINTPEPKVSI